MGAPIGKKCTLLINGNEKTVTINGETYDMNYREGDYIVEGDIFIGAENSNFYYINHNFNGSEYDANNLIQNISNDGTDNGSLDPEGKEIKEYEGWNKIEVEIPTINVADYDTLAITLKTHSWTNLSLEKDLIPQDCTLLRDREGSGWIFTKLDSNSGFISEIREGWLNGIGYVKTLNLDRVLGVDTRSLICPNLEELKLHFAYVKSMGIVDAGKLNKIDLWIANSTLLESAYEQDCFSGLPTEGTLTFKKDVNDTFLSDEEIIAFFKTRVPENWIIINE